MAKKPRFKTGAAAAKARRAARAAPRKELPVRALELEEFVRRLRADTNADKRFALFLGAGCSVSSGIPAAGALVKDHWLPRLRDYQAPTRSDLDTWAGEVIRGYDPANAARWYGDLIDRLFLTPEDRQREIENLCDGRTPSFGYAILAQLIASAEGRFNVVLTTNFDDLVADALYLYTHARPLVIHHESLAAFIRPTRTRPLVVKLHGDHRLSPRNTALETQTLEQEIQRHTAMVLHDRGLIFMGYGGADVGILNMLNDLPREALPYGAYWVHPEEPQGPVRDWLARRQGVWVRSGRFDEVMLLIRNVFDLPHPSPDRFTQIFQQYHQKFQELSASIQAKPADEAGVQALKKALTDTEARFPDFWKAISEATRLEYDDPDRADQIYRDALAQFPNEAPLLGNYANFLRSIGKNYNGAELMYKRAVEADPRHATNVGNYAIFLSDIRKDYDAAEAMYKRALEADPKDADHIGNYAVFLSNVRANHDGAEIMYKQALEADPKNAHHIGNYAVFLSNVRQNYDDAEAMYKRALEADPKHSRNISSYALFLENVRKDYEAAEAMHKRALKADPKGASNLGNYALFLSEVRKDYDAAEAMYKRALEADPTHANNLVNYALFLDHVRKDYEMAQAMYKRALEANPTHATALGHYAILLDVRKNYDDAEAMYKRAVEADPKNANLLANLAGLLLANGNETGLAVLDRALQFLREDPQTDVELECAFYLFAHGSAQQRIGALRSARRLLELGVRSRDWNLSRNVERARIDGNSEAPWLSKLAAVINDDAQLEVLNDWPAWSRAIAL